MKWFRRIILTTVAIGIVVFASIYLINRHISSITETSRRASVADVEAEDPKRTAIVFGAKVWDDGSPSNSLYDRVLTGAELYRSGRAGKLLLSGDKTGENYDEPAAMRKLAIDLGVPDGDLIIDNDGKKTYDTCRRASEVFSVRSAILVTQDYHQPRALYLCRNLGVDSIGVNANRRAYVNEWYYHVREFFSRANAWLEINFTSVGPLNKSPAAQ